KAGYDSILDPLYADGTFEKGPDEWVPDWDNAQGGTLFEQMLTDTGTQVDGVLAAFFALLVVLIIANAAWICRRALRSAEPLPSTEAPYVESRLLVTAGRSTGSDESQEERP
ncbi:hypothetical protein ADL26_11510, partial [Thermoactinomyces vulgaris]